MKLSKATRETVVEALLILLGEAVVSGAVIAVFLIIQQFDLSVLFGAMLGSFVVILNYLILAISVNRAINKYIEKRGQREMTEEEAEKFAEENSSSVTLAAQGTYIVRMLIMLGVLVGAFLLQGVFNVIATLVPLLAFRPIIYVIELVRSKRARADSPLATVTGYGSEDDEEPAAESAEVTAAAESDDENIGEEEVE